MKSFITLFGLFFAIHSIMFVAYASPIRSYQHVQENQKMIADILIPLSKDVPAKKNDIYKALDSVNSICQACKASLEESALLHDRQQKEAVDINSLKNENALLKQQVIELQNKVNESERVAQEQAGRLQKMALERDDLELQIHTSTEKEKSMVNQMQALQETFHTEQASPDYKGKRRGGGKPAFSEETGKAIK